MPAIYIKTFILSFFLMFVAPVFSQENAGPNPADSGPSVDMEANIPIVLDGPDLPEQQLTLPDSGSATTNQNDIVVLLERSPASNPLESGVLLEQLSSQGPETYVGVMGFNNLVSVVQPLIASNELDSESIQNAFNDVAIDGASNDIGRALERAIYELKYNGRADVGKRILLIGNTGDASSDTESAGLSATIITDISENQISLDAVALSDVSMNYLSRSLNGLQNTAIHVIMDIAELGEIVESLLTSNNTVNTDQVVTSSAEAVQELPQAQPVQTQSQVSTSPPAVSSAIDEVDNTRTYIIIISAIILIVTLGALIVLLYLRMKTLSGTKKVDISEAYLKDIHGYTANESYRLGRKATMLGRVAGKDSENLDYFVIPETTIGRRHAVIEYKDYAYWITDQGSINGTFVNNIPITSEVRLKHGDSVRLHKFEFEFSIPELDEAGMTKISSTVLADHAEEEMSLDSPEIHDVKENISSDGLDLDFGEATAENPVEPEQPAPASEETLLPGHDLDEQGPGNSADETLMPDSGSTDSRDVESSGDENQEPEPEIPPEPQHDDATIMPGDLDGLDDEDDTIRPK